MSGRPRSLGQREILEGREKECFSFLSQIPLGRRYVLIGGYAVSSFQFPRFSVDLDIVLPSAELSFFQELAQKRGFSLRQERRIEKFRTGKSLSYLKNIGVAVSIDLLVNLVYSRQTSFAYSFRYLSANSEVREVRGRGLEARARARVADREMLVALKANSIREHDMRDILALCYEKPLESKVTAHLEKCPRRAILAHLDRLRVYIEGLDPDSFKGAFGSTDIVLRRSVTNCTKLLETLGKNLPLARKPSIRPISHHRSLRSLGTFS